MAQRRITDAARGAQPAQGAAAAGGDLHSRATPTWPGPGSPCGAGCWPRRWTSRRTSRSPRPPSPAAATPRRPTCWPPGWPRRCGCPVRRARTRAGTGMVSVRLERRSGDIDLVRPDGVGRHPGPARSAGTPDLAAAARARGVPRRRAAPARPRRDLRRDPHPGPVQGRRPPVDDLPPRRSPRARRPRSRRPASSRGGSPARSTAAAAPPWSAPRRRPTRPPARRSRPPLSAAGDPPQTGTPAAATSPAAPGSRRPPPRSPRAHEGAPPRSRGAATKAAAKKPTGAHERVRRPRPATKATATDQGPGDATKATAAKATAGDGGGAGRSRDQGTGLCRGRQEQPRVARAGKERLVTRGATGPGVVVHRDKQLLADAAAARLVTAVVDAQASRGSAARRADRRLDGLGDPGVARRSRRPATRSTGASWTSGGATSGSCPPATRSATRPRPGRPCSTPCHLDPARVHPMPAPDGPTGRDVDAAAAGYARELAAAAGRGEDVPAFDVLMLGVGPDGARRLAVPRAPGAARDATASAVAVRGAPKPPPVRVSLTFPALCAARDVWFLVVRRRQGRVPSAWRCPAPARCRLRRPVSAAPAPRRGCWTATPPRTCRGQLVRPGQPLSTRRPTPSPRRTHRTSLLAAWAEGRPSSWDQSLGQRISPRSRSVLQRLVQDRLAVGVAAPLLHVGQVRLVRLDARRRPAGSSWSWPAGKPQRGQSQVSGTAGPAPRRSWAWSRGRWRTSRRCGREGRPRRARPRPSGRRRPGCLGSRCHLPRVYSSGRSVVRRRPAPASAPAAGRQLEKRSIRPSPTMAANQTSPTATVKRSRLRSAHRRAAQRDGHAAAEHVGQPAALALVQQDQQGQEQAGEDQHDLEADRHGFHGRCPSRGVGGRSGRAVTGAVRAPAGRGQDADARAGLRRAVEDVRSGAGHVLAVAADRRRTPRRRCWRRRPARRRRPSGP